MADKKGNMGIDNTGNLNSGNLNSGHWNSGNLNSGNRNSGHWNSGNLNSGNRNSGHLNSGNRNSGNLNSGHWNSGNLNSGNRNSGHWNSGHLNSGHWNSGNLNSGSFNRDCPKMRLFEKELDMTAEEFYENYNIYMDIPLNRWIYKDDMTDSEKKEVTGWETMGGYLKTLPFKEACQIWWDENPDDHERFLTLPGFDETIFTEITGIELKTTSKNPEFIEIYGAKYKLVK